MTEHTSVNLTEVCLWGQADTANSQSSEFKMRYVWTSATTVVLISVIYRKAPVPVRLQVLHHWMCIYFSSLVYGTKL